MTILQAVQHMIDGRLPPMPVATLVGFRVTAIEPGRSRVELDTTAQHANPMGVTHGGVLCTIADSAMGLAYGATLGEGETFATLELKINFLRPVQRASLVAEAVVLHRGRNVGVVDCTVTDHDGRLVAKATSTCMTQRNQQLARVAGAAEVSG